MNSLLCLDSIRPLLDIAPINTGRSYPLTTPSGIITDDIEGLHAIQDEYGQITLQSGVEYPTYMYRGQPAEHVPCVPSLGRLKSIEEKILALCRNVAFEDAVIEHPFVRVSLQAIFLGLPLRIDTQGLAQHYGLKTDLLDITSNFDVASFFATSYWDDVSQSYQPIRGSEIPGVIYRINTVALENSNMNAQAKLGLVGWQPLSRPEQQRASVIKLTYGEDLCRLPAVQMVKFRQSEQVSVRIWEEFDKGRVLFPKDDTDELAKRAQTLTHFTRQQVNKAWDFLNAWNGSRVSSLQRHTIENDIGISLSTKNILNWDAFDVERNEIKLNEQLQEVLNRAKYRRTCYL